MPRVKTGTSASLQRKLRKVRLVIFDVDGTLTDGSVFLSAGDEMKSFHIADGLGIRLLLKGGIEVAFITGRTSAAVERRATELGVRHVIQGEGKKGAAARRLIQQLGLAHENVAAMGDDLPDLAVFDACGARLAVADAAEEVRAAADWISKKPGGHAAARETAELILKAQGVWKSLVKALMDETE